MLFRSFSSFCFEFGKPVPFIYEVNNSLFNELGLNFNSLINLNSIGVINLNNQGNTHFVPDFDVFNFNYFEKKYVAKKNSSSNAGFHIGFAALTEVGEQLFPIVDAQPIPNFETLVLEKIRNSGYSIENA